MPEKILTVAEAAKVLRVSLSTLGRLDKAGEGPPKIRLSRGRVIYREADLAAAGRGSCCSEWLT